MPLEVRDLRGQEEGGQLQRLLDSDRIFLIEIIDPHITQGFTVVLQREKNHAPVIQAGGCFFVAMKKSIWYDISRICLSGY